MRPLFEAEKNAYGDLGNPLSSQIYLQSRREEEEEEEEEEEAFVLKLAHVGLMEEALSVRERSKAG